MTALVVGVVLDGSRKQRVDKRGFSQTRLSSNLHYQSVSPTPNASFLAKTNHNSEGRAPFGDDLVSVGVRVSIA